jgi:hypothetical protein
VESGPCSAVPCFPGHHIQRCLSCAGFVAANVSKRLAVEFGVGIGEYEGVVRVPRQVFRRFVDGAATPERCLEAFHLQRTRFELIAERKLRNRQLTDVVTDDEECRAYPRVRWREFLSGTGGWPQTQS